MAQYLRCFTRIQFSVITAVCLRILFGSRLNIVQKSSEILDVDSLNFRFDNFYIFVNLALENQFADWRENVEITICSQAPKQDQEFWYHHFDLWNSVLDLLSGQTYSETSGILAGYLPRGNNSIFFRSIAACSCHSLYHTFGIYLVWLDWRFFFMKKSKSLIKDVQKIFRRRKKVLDRRPRPNIGLNSASRNLPRVGESSVAIGGGERLS